MQAPSQRNSPNFSLQKARILPQTPAISLNFAPGIHSLVTSRKDYAQALIECLAGLRQPLGSPWSRGSIRLGASDPFASPGLRAQLGITLPTEPALPAAPTLHAALDQILTLRLRLDTLATGSPHHIPFVESLLQNAPHSLTGEQRRRVALGLALSLRAPQALVLYQPLFNLNFDDAAFVLQRLRHYAESDVPIICVTATLADAEKLSPLIHHLSATSQNPAAQNAYKISCSEPQKLAELARKQPGFAHVDLPENHPHCLVVELASQDPSEQALMRLLAEAPGVIFQVEKTTHDDGATP